MSNQPSPFLCQRIPSIGVPAPLRMHPHHRGPMGPCRTSWEASFLALICAFPPGPTGSRVPFAQDSALVMLSKISPLRDMRIPACGVYSPSAFTNPLVLLSEPCGPPSSPHCLFPPKIWQAVFRNASVGTETFQDRQFFNQNQSFSPDAIACSNICDFVFNSFHLARMVPPEVPARHATPRSPRFGDFQRLRFPLLFRQRIERP